MGILCPLFASVQALIAKGNVSKSWIEGSEIEQAVTIFDADSILELNGKEKLLKSAHLNLGNSAC